ncbi:Glycosyltransferase Family 4 [Abditibacterium utsteinense]|uniref:Glycosyltransferase Family 4 n=1 Tax=Abditibacterium utsteinense TaxID=1960156 RepID=A0A2S8SSE7_9BACT|nr:glycosyltransferase family 1 protein [Abditibacterium utsteinense]PQV63698.1 Glycosyltransferase Family 4 [Abditibacterium utsteinense]
MPAVHFLSQNRPGPRMGMGHYERLLIQHVMAETSRQEWQFDFTCDGRVSAESIRADESMHPDFASVNGLGFATVRLADWPWPLACAVMNRRFGARGSKTKKTPDLFHSLALTFPAPSIRPALYIIHDLPAARFSDEGRLPKWSKQAARDARLIVTPSEFGKREIVELLEVDPSKVQVVFNGLEHDLFNTNVPVADAAALAQLGITGSFLIYAGGHSQRKNVPALLEAWKIVAPRHPELSLVLAGPPGLKTLAETHGAPRVIAPGYVDRSLLPGVMRAARALVYPSIYEGFGLPPQEAMAMGVPVVASRAGGAVPEVVGDAGILAEDGTSEALARAIELLLGDSDLEARLRLAGPKRAKLFSWPEHARTVLEIYRSLLA